MQVGSLAVAVASTTLLVAVAPRHSLLAVLLVAVSTAACAVLVVFERRRPRLGLRPIAAAVGVVFVVALIAPPRASNDIWSYAIYGRMVSVHHASPYEHVPADFRSDPLFDEVSPVWRHRGSVYGPAFVAFAAGVTYAAGDSPTTTRVLFQLAAAIVVTAVLALVWRRTRSPAAVAWLGLHPLFGATVVNSGQVDAFVGLAILAGALLATQRRGIAAGVSIAAAALTKLTALLALVGLVLWGWRRREQRVAVSAVAATSALVVLVYLPFIRGAFGVLEGADHTVTPGSFWSAPAQWLVGHDAGRDLSPLESNTTLTTLFYLSLVLVVLLAIGVSWVAARAERAEPAVGTATASYTVAAEYTLPWYAAWSLPALADRTPSAVAWVVWLQAAVLLAAWKLPSPVEGGALETVVRGLLLYAAPVALLVAFAIVGTMGARRRSLATRIVRA
ncbi:MAG TPA: glycosyltransferase 87 family protein [Acidimicrobiia bacterium]|nr:glycosyltransferase 87 family protein [Acidimicrobiia bacterium]